MSLIDRPTDSDQQGQPNNIMGLMGAGKQVDGRLAMDLEPFIGERNAEVISFHRGGQVLATDGALVEIPGRLGMASIYDLVRRAWCRCPRLPWSPHRHRFDLGDRS